MYSSLTNQYRYLLSLFIKQEVLQSKSLADIDPADSQQHRQLESIIDLGGCCEAQLLRQPLADKEVQFRKDALSFLIELCVQIKSRFPL